MRSKEQGSALITTIMVMVLVLGLIAAGLTLTTGERTLASHQVKSTQALYLAEAGVEKAIAQLQVNSSWTGEGNSNTPISLGKGGYWVTVSPNSQGSQYKDIVSIGKVHNVQRQLKLTIELPDGGAVGGINPVFTNGIFGSSRVEIGNNSNINGNVASKSYIDAKNNANVNGNKITNSPLTIPVLNEGEYNISGAKSFPSFSNNSNIDLTGGIYFVDGDLDISNNVNISGNGTVYVKGNLDIGNNVNINGTVAFLVTGKAVLSNNANLNGGVIFGLGDVTLDENSKIRGSAVAGGTMSIDNNSTVDYDYAKVTSSDLKLPGALTFKIKSWKYN